MPRDYKKEYRDFYGKAAPRKRRAAVNRARRKVGLKKGDKREVDHWRSLRNGGGNARGNLRIVSRNTNRRKGTR